MPLLQEKGQIYYFAVYDEITHDLLYTGFNFLFEEYKIYRGFPPETTKQDLFYEFLIENNSTMDKPFFVREDLKQFFGPMTIEIVKYFNSIGFSALYYMMGASPDGYYTFDYLYENQFNFIEINDNWRRLQDYIYREPSGKFYSKYNFNFDLWTADFNNWGNKLCMFTDFVVRTIFLSNQLYGTYGYGFPPEQFKKYFFDNYDISEYIIDYGVTSVYKVAYRNLYNIDYKNYGEVNLDLNVYNGNVELLQEHYLRYGQFERRVITFIRPPDVRKKYFNTLTLVNAGVEYGSGFLYNGGQDYSYVGGKKQLFMVTCYHLIANNANKNILRASINYKTSEFNETDSQTIQLEFRVIGYEIFSDIVVGVYDPNLDFNKIFNPTLDVSEIYALDFNIQTVLQNGQTVLTVSNLSTIDNSSYLEGKLIDQNYSGNFTDSNILGAPYSLLINFFTQSGSSGSPIFIELPDKELQLVGMITGQVGTTSQYTLALAPFTFNQIVYNITGRWFGLVAQYINDPKVFSFFIRDGWPKRWLGIKYSYFSPTISPKRYGVLSNLNYSGGLIVEDFVVGFNTSTQQFVYSYQEVAKLDCIVFKTALLETEMYRKFIESSRTPLVIKSILFFDNAISQTNKFYLGKFGNQASYNIITYNMINTATNLNEPKYTNRLIRRYNTIQIEYYYYNGREWVLKSELVGANTPDWYNEYSDPLGNTYKEHRFDYPSILIPYLQPYILMNSNAMNNTNTAGDTIQSYTQSTTVLSSYNGSGKPKVACTGGGCGNNGSNSNNIFG